MEGEKRPQTTTLPSHLEDRTCSLYPHTRESLCGRRTRRHPCKKLQQRQVHHRGRASCEQIERVQGTERGNDYVRKGVSVLITGAAGTDKSWLGTALGHQACMNGCKVAYYNVYRLFEEIALARIASTLHLFFAKLAQTDLLILDDFGMKVLDGQQLLGFMEIIEDRHGQKATIIISQLPVSDWYDVMRG